MEHKDTKAQRLLLAQSGKLCVFVSLCSVKIIPSYYLIITKLKTETQRLSII